MKALLTNYRQSPRKVRLVANMIRGKTVTQARQALTFLPQKSSPALLKLLNSAVSNARNAGVSDEDLFIKMLAVNKGTVMYRFMPKARGRAARYAKTMSIVTLELGNSATGAKAPKAKGAKPVRPGKTVAKKAAKPARSGKSTKKAEATNA